MHAGLVNQLIACHWLENGVELTSVEQKEISQKEIIQKIQQAKRRKIKLDF